MTQISARRTTFSFAAPVDDATAWHLRLDGLASSLTEAFPEGAATLEGGLGPREADSLSFEVPLGEGVWLRGLATSPYPEMGSVMVMDASAAEAAAFGVWLRDSFVPSPELVHFTSEMALDRGEEAYWVVPVRKRR